MRPAQAALARHEGLARFWLRLDTALAPAVAAGLAATAFALARLVVYAHGRIGAFVVAGSIFVNAKQVPAGVPVQSGHGYDGQFYYRMALDPAKMSGSAFGIHFDTISRLERIGYPALTWLLAFGRHAEIPAALVILNILALAALGLAGGLLAREGGRHALLGLVVPAYWGYLWSLGRDLTEITAAAFLVLGLIAYRRERWLLAAALLVAAVLTKETAAYAVAILGLTRLFLLATGRARRPFGATDAAWIAPGLAFGAWQLIVRANTGIIPLIGASQRNVGLPLAGMLPAIGHYVAELPARVSLLWTAELAIIIIIAGAGVSVLRRTTAPIHERLAFLAFVLLAISAAGQIWQGAVGFRSLDDVVLFAWMLLLSTPRRPLRVLPVLTAVAWIVVAGELIINQ